MTTPVRDTQEMARGLGFEDLATGVAVMKGGGPTSSLADSSQGTPAKFTEGGRFTEGIKLVEGGGFAGGGELAEGGELTESGELVEGNGVTEGV